jgi:hypothetical protein
VNDIQWLERVLNEQDAVIEKLQRRVEILERANLDVIAFLQWKARQHERKKPTARTTTRRKR